MQQMLASSVIAIPGFILAFFRLGLDANSLVPKASVLGLAGHYAH
jgi:hypothetical protein